MHHIFLKFTELKYPRGLLIQLQKKAKEIWSHPPKSGSRDSRSRDDKPARISIPNFEGVDSIVRYLESAGMRVVITTGRKSGELLKNKQKGINTNKTSVVYQIPCGGCPKKYVGETGRGLKTRLAEHKRDVREHRLSNAMVLHIEGSNHLPRWEGASILQECAGKQLRRATEAAYIMLNDTTNTRAGFYTLGKCTAKLALLKR